MTTPSSDRVNDAKIWAENIDVSDDVNDVNYDHDFQMENSGDLIRFLTCKEI